MTPRQREDPGRDSSGYDARAAEFIARRTPAIGAAVIRGWAESLPQGAEVLELGCGHGIPGTRILVEAGLRVRAIDGSAALVAAFRERFPDLPVERAAVQDSSFFGRTFDAVLAWGLLFLLDPADQAAVIRKVADTLRPGGSFLFTAPWQAAEWIDELTGRTSVSLGRERYRALLQAAGLLLEREGADDGGNHYWVARRTPPPP